MADEGWTLDELADRVRRALRGASDTGDYTGPRDSRARDIPDRRAIRWYTTLGIVDRPCAMRGRTALYGPRHLSQLVAIKRRQAEGRTLVEIQAELAGLDDAELGALAEVPVEPGQPETFAGEEVRTRSPQPGGPDPRGVRERRFWAQPVLTQPESVESSVREDDPVGVISGITLPGGVTILLPVPPSDQDVEAVARAAAPLLETLAARGLTKHSNSWRSPR